MRGKRRGRNTPVVLGVKMVVHLSWVWAVGWSEVWADRGGKIRDWRGCRETEA